MVAQPARSTLFPYTTLFRSHAVARGRLALNLILFSQLVLLLRHGDAERLQRSAGQVVQKAGRILARSEEHTSELQSRPHLVCSLLLEKKKTTAMRSDVIGNF